MKKSKLTIFLSLILVMIFVVTACGDKSSNSSSTSSGNRNDIVIDTGSAIDSIESATADGKTLGMSVTYDGDKTMMKFQSAQYANYNSTVDGVHYGSGEFKPAWAELQKRLNFTINDRTPLKDTSTSAAYSTLAGQGFPDVDIVNGPVTSIVQAGTNTGTFVNLYDYRYYLPNLFKVIKENEIVRQSVTAADGSIYYAPYFDGIDDVETMFICRTDWVEVLLDDNIEKYDTDVQGFGAFDGTADGQITYDTQKTLDVSYDGFYDSMETSFVVSKSDEDGTKTLTANDTQKVTVSYTSDNGIIARQNRLANTERNGANLVQKLKEYIKEVYMAPGKEVISKPSELFIGQNACYNADELIALWRCVVTNPKLLSGNANTVMVPFYPRHKSADRAAQVLQLAQIWGVRGYESRNGYFYLDDKGILQDARVSADMMQALEFLHEIYEEGLICQDYSTGAVSGAEEYRDAFNKENRGFMTYDYNQTTTIYNENIHDSYSYYRNLSPILYPVADWDNKAVANSGDASKYSVNGDNVLYQYTESWRSVKTEGWAILQSTANKADKGYLKKALEVLDYMYSDEGQILMTYGPKDWMEQDASGNIVNIDYFGRQVPKISTAALNELESIGAGNYTNYYRYYVGSTLPIGFIKEQGMEYQAADDLGKVGLKRVETAAMVTKTLKHATLTQNEENIQNTLITTTFPLEDSVSTKLASSCTNLYKYFNNSSASGQNIFHDYVINGFDSSKTLSKTGLVEMINKDYGLSTYMSAYRPIYYSMYH